MFGLLQNSEQKDTTTWNFWLDFELKWKNTFQMLNLPNSVFLKEILLVK